MTTRPEFNQLREQFAALQREHRRLQRPYDPTELQQHLEKVVALQLALVRYGHRLCGEIERGLKGIESATRDR